MICSAHLTNVAGKSVNTLSATEKYRNFIRLNAAYWSLKAERAMERLGRIVMEMAE